MEVITIYGNDESLAMNVQDLLLKIKLLSKFATNVSNEFKRR